MNDIVLFVLSMIENLGYDAYLIGGFVRDSLWGFSNLDVDICTNAPVKVLSNLFKDYKFKIFKNNTMKIKINNINFDIAQMRNEIFDNNKTIVNFTNDLKLDYLRRDFTFNSIYEDKNGCFYSFNGSINDCIDKNILFIGDSSFKIFEDPSRLLRFIYFILKYDLNYKKILFDKNSLSLYLKQNNNLYNFKQYINKIKKLNKDIELRNILKNLDIYDLFSKYFNV